jgi:hypothetical protein
MTFIANAPMGQVRRSPGDEHRESLHTPLLQHAARGLKEVLKLLQAGQQDGGAGFIHPILKSSLHPGASGQRRAERDMLESHYKARSEEPEREETRLFLLNYRREPFLIQGAFD